MTVKIETAMVLAAGLGSRMRPLTLDRPKALVEVAGRPLIDHMLDRLEAAGIQRAVVNIHAFADMVEAHLSARKGPMQIIISDERARALETGGGLKHARPLLGDAPIFVANIDSIWIERGAPTLADMMAAYDPDLMDILQLTTPTQSAVGYDRAGDFFISEAGQVSMRGAAPSAPYVQIGVHITRPQLVYDWPGEVFGLFDLWVRVASRQRMYARVLDGRWMHVGDPAARDAAEAIFASEAAR